MSSRAAFEQAVAGSALGLLLKILKSFFCIYDVLKNGLSNLLISVLVILLQEIEVLTLVQNTEMLIV